MYVLQVYYLCIHFEEVYMQNTFCLWCRNAGAFAKYSGDDSAFRSLQVFFSISNLDGLFSTFSSVRPQSFAGSISGLPPRAHFHPFVIISPLRYHPFVSPLRCHSPLEWLKELDTSDQFQLDLNRISVYILRLYILNHITLFGIARCIAYNIV